jgi:malate dehydrogenase (oxaloacetate-decarboxylating)(NADP+)
VRARAINDEMKMAATRALAELAQAGRAGVGGAGVRRRALPLRPEYLIPKPFDPRIMLWVAPAVARAAMETGRGAAVEIDLEAYRGELDPGWGAGAR